MIKFYRFDFDKGVPVQGGQLRWRKGQKTISAYCLQDAIEKFAMPTFKQFGTTVKVNIVQAWSSLDKKNWTELNLDAVIIAGWLVGAKNRPEVKRILARQTL